MILLRPTNRPHRPAARRKGQALVEFALMGLFLGMLLFGLVYAWRKGMLRWE